LLEDGRIDRAMAVARGAVQERPDFWMPALFLRLRLGCIWDESEGLVKGDEDEQPGFGRSYEVRLKAMVNAVCKKIGQCGHDIERLIPSFSFVLIAIALLAGLVICSVKYLHPVPKTSTTNKSVGTQQQRIPTKDFDPPENSETEIKTVSTPESKNEAYDTMTDPATSMEFVYIPKGCFMMGSPDNEKGRNNKEGPVAEVCVNDFWMGKYEVTQGQWLKIMGENPSQFRNGDDFPLEKASWNKIQEFIAELNKQSGKEYRLPTEAEWEYAARAGTTTSRHWGDDISCKRAMYRNSKGQEVDECMDYIRSRDELIPYSTAPVGSYPPNQFGLHDMLGNVSEFCSNWLGDYPTILKDNPQGHPKGDLRVFRGGSLNSDGSWIRSAARYGFSPQERNNGFGFRLVLPVQQSHKTPAAGADTSIQKSDPKESDVDSDIE
ncbi:MAG: formylglycine-generating enzyme family protein, partial [Candidatus Electrothrix sp. GM3_4]|nr:formylglycine-generating enzyme family protein [Candidatus Electrothrix sp. GM3_4]